MGWLVIIVMIVVAAFLGYRYFYTDEGQQLAQQAEQTVEQAADQAADTAEQAGEAVEGAVDEAREAVEGAADEAAGTAEQAAESTEQAAEEAAQAGEQTAEEATRATEQAAESAAGSAEQATESAGGTVAALTVGGVDLGKEVGSSVSDATSALGGITDKASAEAALPRLKAVESKLGELGGKVEQLPQQGKEALASLVGDALPALRDMVNKIEGMEGVSEVVKPTLDSIMAKLDAWAKQPA